MMEVTLAEKLVGPLGRSRIFLWVVPADARGRWELRIAQSYQMIEVEARAGAAPMIVRGARLRGEEVRIAVTGLVGGKPWNHLFRGTLAGGTMQGEVRVSDGNIERTLPWKASRQQ